MREFEEDPLIYHGKARCGWASALVNSTLEIGPRMWEISLPILLIHGVEDRLVPIVASEFAYTNVSSEDKTFEVENVFHTISLFPDFLPGTSFE